MPSLTRRIKTKSFFRPVHLQAIIFLVVYNILSKTLFVRFILSENYFINFLGPYIFGVLSGSIFLYLLRHDDFFHFMKEVEEVEKRKEKKLIKKFLQHSKVLTALVITTIGGPMFGALTIRLLLPKYKYQIAFLVIGNIFSTILSVSIAKGIVLGFTK